MGHLRYYPTIYSSLYKDSPEQTDFACEGQRVDLPNSHLNDCLKSSSNLLPLCCPICKLDFVYFWKLKGFNRSKEDFAARDDGAIRLVATEAGDCY